VETSITGHREDQGRIHTGVTEFEFERCRNATFHPHLNLADVRRQFSVEFEFDFAFNKY